MALRLVQKFDNGTSSARVMRDTEWQEYRVQFTIKGKHVAANDYHTDDREDALSTARVWLSAQRVGEEA